MLPRSNARAVLEPATIALAFVAMLSCKTASAPTPASSPEPVVSSTEPAPSVACEHTSETKGYIARVSADTIAFGTTDGETFETSLTDLRARMSEFRKLYPDATFYVVADSEAKQAADIRKAAADAGFIDIRSCDTMEARTPPPTEPGSIGLGGGTPIGTPKSDTSPKPR
jgi:hypothetical protein